MKKPRQLYVMSWEEVFQRIQMLGIDEPENTIFGVPRGGMCLCTALQKAKVTHEPDRANIILDDIIDSGMTRQSYMEAYPTADFFAIVDKQNCEVPGFDTRHEQRKQEYKTQADWGWLTPSDTTLGWIQFPWEEEDKPEDAVVRLLEYIGEDPARGGIVNTPKRVCKALREMTAGYDQNADEVLGAVFEMETDEMIVLNGIRFTSLCEHHMLPFSGVASVGYIPDGKKVVGISKLARVVQVFAKRLQIQERMTAEIANAISDKLSPIGVGVIIRAHHSCMGCRGANQPDADMVTSCMLGAMREKDAARVEFLRLSGNS